MVSKKKFPKTEQRSKRYMIPVIAVLLVGAVAVAGFFWLRGSDSTPSKPDTYQKDTTPRPTTSKGDTGGLPGTSQPNEQKPAPVNPNNLPVTAPSGSFVSNHKPGQNGSPQEESSVCLTTPGASCEIIFTKDGVTKSLGAQIADSSGAAYWSAWTAQSTGLTTGDWSVSATATWGQQTASTTDPIALQVRP
jgi:hypothetical protein